MTFSYLPSVGRKSFQFQKVMIHSDGYSMAAGVRHGSGAASDSSHLNPPKENRERTLMAQIFKFSKSAPSDIVLPRKSHFLSLPKQCHQPETKYSDAQEYVGHFHSNHHSYKTEILVPDVRYLRISFFVKEALEIPKIIKAIAKVLSKVT